MSPRKISFVISLVVSMLCLAAGYALAGEWIGAVFAILTGPSWLFARKHPSSWLPSLCLLMSVGLAVVGRLLGAAPWLMIYASGIALAAWDLLLLNASLDGNASGEQTRRYENKHLQSLALALGAGLLVTFLGRLLNPRLPFLLLAFLVALVIFGLDRIWDYLKKRSMRVKR
jgi:hypothetical protein